MSSKIVLKKKELVGGLAPQIPLLLEGDMGEDPQIIVDHTILPVATGPFSAKMRGGLSISVTKSGYQKSIRRGYYNLANVFGLLWWEVGVLYPPLMTNLINRLIVIAGEDCAGNLRFLHWIDQKVAVLRQKNELFKKKFKQSGSQGVMVEVKELSRDICLVTTMLVKSSKTRVSSWAKGVFYDGLNHPVICDQVEELYPGILDLKTQFDQLDLLSAYQNALSSLYPLLSIRYAYMAYAQQEKSLVNSMWVHLLKIKNDEHVQLFYRWFQKEKSENRIYLILAHIYVFQSTLFEMKDIDESQAVLLMNEWNQIVNNGKIRFPSWMQDMHTVEGKKKGMNGIDFANVGSHIENMWMPLCNQKWIDIYRANKGLEVGELSSPITPLNTQVNKQPIVMKIPILKKGAMGDSVPQVIKKTILKKGAMLHHPMGDTVASQVSDFPQVIKKTILTKNVNIEKGILTDELKSIITGPQVPRGQLVTATYKPYVYLPREHPQWVYKGPFPIKRASRLQLLKRRHQTFQILGTPAIDLELMTASDHSIWVKYQNLATVSPDKWKTETKHDNINGMDVEIIVRESLGFSQLSKLTKSEIEKILFDGDYPFYLAFLDAALLNCGDMGDHNSLVILGSNIPQAYLIDYDDSTTRTSFETYYDVYRKTSSAQKSLFDKRVPTIKDKILARISLYKEKQSQLELSLGSNLNKIINEIETVYMKL